MNTTPHPATSGPEQPRRTYPKVMSLARLSAHARRLAHSWVKSAAVALFGGFVMMVPVIFGFESGREAQLILAGFGLGMCSLAIVFVALALFELLVGLGAARWDGGGPAGVVPAPTAAAQEGQGQ